MITKGDVCALQSRAQGDMTSRPYVRLTAAILHDFGSLSWMALPEDHVVIGDGRVPTAYLALKRYIEEA